MSYTNASMPELRIILRNISKEDTFYKYLTNNEKKGRRSKYLRCFTNKRTCKIIKKKKLTN
jgi:hypothetical protein